MIKQLLVGLAVLTLLLGGLGQAKADTVIVSFDDLSPTDFFSPPPANNGGITWTSPD